MLENFIYNRTLPIEIKVLFTQKQSMNNYENECNTAYVLLTSLNLLIMSSSLITDFHFSPQKYIYFDCIPISCDLNQR